MDGHAVRGFLETPEIQAEIMFHDARFVALDGNTQKALEILHQAAVLAPGNQNIQEAIKQLTQKK
ncbi:MAG TPA: hypothetical protein VJG67_02105 [Candidatus Paceibacterota bacterium]